MTTAEIERQVRLSLESGVQHHFYDNETRAYSLLSLEPDKLKQYLVPEMLAPSLEMYEELLGPTKVRSVKNGIIAFITLVSRAAIQAGLDPEFSYALSDYYINYLETLSKEDELIQLMIQITLHYNDLIHRSVHTGHSHMVDAALRYMQQRLYSRCRVADTAAFVGLEPHYFASRFKQEMGVSPSFYLMELKMREAKKLLLLPGYSVTSVAAVLGFSDAAHFSKRFKQFFGVSPKTYQK